MRSLIAAEPQSTPFNISRPAVSSVLADSTLVVGLSVAVSALR